MKRAKLILPSRMIGRKGNLLGKDAKLVDADTGEQIQCVQGLSVDFPLNGVIVANAQILISEIETIGDEP